MSALAPGTSVSHVCTHGGRMSYVNVSANRGREETGVWTRDSDRRVDPRRVVTERADGNRGVHCVDLVSDRE